MSLFFSVSNSNLSSRTQYKFWLIEWLLLVTKSYRILCDPMDCSPPGSSAHGIFQARVPEWGAIAFSPIQYTNAYIWNLERW